MKGIVHKLHGLRSSLAHLGGFKLKRVAEPQVGHLIESRVIQSGGEMQLNNSAEAWFYHASEATRVHRWPDAPLFRLRDMWCVGDQGHLFFQDGTLFDRCPTVRCMPDRKVRRPIPTLSKTVTHPVLHLTGFSHDSHGHFILHHLPRLLACRDLLRAAPAAKILCAPGHSRWQMRYLRRLGFDESRVIEGTRGTLRLNEVWYVPWMAGTFKLVAPDLLRGLREAFVQPAAGAASVDSVPAGAPLFISRKDAPDKILANEEELVMATEKLFGGVEHIELGRFPMDEQVRAFRRAPLVIGALGQGLTNMIYTHAGRLVILERGTEPLATAAHSMFTMLTSVCGGEALPIFCQSAYSGPRRQWTFPVSKYVADMTRIRKRWFLCHA
jgi:hypothetical protein